MKDPSHEKDCRKSKESRRRNLKEENARRDRRRENRHFDEVKRT